MLGWIQSERKEERKIDKEYMSKLIEELLGVPFAKIPIDAQHNVPLFDGFTYTKKEVAALTNIYQKCQDFLDPILYENVGAASYIVLPNPSSFFVVGPFFIQQASDVSGISSFHGKKVPTITKKKLNEWVELFYYVLYEKKGVVMVTSDTIQEAKRISVEEFLENVQTHEREVETVALKLVERGEVEKLRKFLNEHPLNRLEKTGILATKSVMRHYKNISIVAVTLATRKAIQGGVFPEIAYTLSDYAIQNIEESRTLTDIGRHVKECLLVLTTNVNREQKSHFGPLTNKARGYIAEHVYEEISREKIAEKLHVSATHLDRVFKEETGQTVFHYIKREKMEIAKELIDLQGHTMTEIARLLHFSSLHAFSKAFRHHYDMTPSTYKKIKKVKATDVS